MNRMPNPNKKLCFWPIATVVFDDMGLIDIRRAFEASRQVLGEQAVQSLNKPTRLFADQVPYLEINGLQLRMFGQPMPVNVKMGTDGESESQRIKRNAISTRVNGISVHLHQS